MADLADAAGPASTLTSALLDTLFDSAPLGLAFVDADGRFERVNAGLAAMHGLPPEAHVGRRPSDILPALGAQLEDTFRRALDTTNGLRDIEVTGETPSAPGVTRQWRASYVPVRGAASEPLGLVVLVVEVTGEREATLRAEAALQRSATVDAELRALYAALPVGVAFLDSDLRYRRVNQTLAAMNGRTVDEHLGASIEEVLGEVAASLVASLRDVADRREPLEIQVQAPLPGDPDTARALEAMYFPVVEADGDLLGVGSVVRDVSDRMAAELEQSRLLREALVARAEAEAAEVRADDAREEAERTREEAERARERMALLARAGTAMADGAMNWEATLRAVVRGAVPAVADWAAVTVQDPGGRLRVAAVAHADPAREEPLRELFRRYPPGRSAAAGPAHAIRTRQTEVLEDITPEALKLSARDPEHLELLQAMRIRHSAVAPLETPAGVLGALTFVLGESGRRFAPDDVDLLEGLAARAALHLQTARLYTERSHIAQTLQASLRPRPIPALPGADVAARFLPAGDYNEVGGDFYEVFRSGDAVWTAIVGDVSGKGAEAAAVTALARHTLRTASMLHDDPAANLALLNRVLYEDSTALKFCTAFYARLCPADDGYDLRFANGGHPPPLLLRRDGRVEDVTSGRGPLVGGILEAQYAEGTLRLQPGELLLLYTDGVTEVRTSDVELGERELRATLAGLAGASAEAVVEAVERRAVELQSGAPRDDIALVAVKARDDGAPARATVAR